MDEIKYLIDPIVTIIKSISYFIHLFIYSLTHHQSHNMTDLFITKPCFTEKFKYRERKSTTITKPEKNKSAFLMFSNDMRSIFKQNNKQLGQNHIMKQLASLWNEATHEQKTRYQILAQQDKDRYLREKQDFLAANPSANFGYRTKKNHVHKPRSGYAVFMSERFSYVKDVYPHLETGEIVSKVAKEWRSLTQQQKAVYKQEADEEKLSKRMELQKRVVKDLASITQASSRMNSCEEKEEEEEGRLCKIVKKVKTDTEQCIKNQRESTYSHQFLSEDSLYSPTEGLNEPLQSSETSYQYDLYSQGQPMSKPESFSYATNFNDLQTLENNEQNDAVHLYSQRLISCLNLEDFKPGLCWEYEPTSKSSHKEEIINFFDDNVDVDHYSRESIFDNDYFENHSDDLWYFS